MRLRGYSDDVPKPMVHIGTRPILWHLMKYYAHFGHKDFILCLGYKGNTIKDYFLHYDESASNDFVWSNGGKDIHFLNRDIDDWKITFVETGANANLGQRLQAVESYLTGEEIFLLNYSDGLSDVPLPLLVDAVERSKAIASLLLVQPTASFDIVHAGSEV
jgi:glucose-1-phosphate cytidylyltransferase